MSYIDRALKILADKFATDYVKWILGRSVILVEKLSTELPASTKYTDLVYRVIDEQNRESIFHLEFQAQRSKEPMNLRMLGYNVRLIYEHNLPVCSTVIYLVKGSDAGDQGYFKSICPSGEEVLNFRYKVIKLWELDGVSILKEKILGLYPLLGLTKLTEPTDKVFREIISEIKNIENTVIAHDTLYCFKLLSEIMHPKELLDALIRKEDIMESTIAKEIYQDGLEEGLIKGKLETLQDNIMGVLLARFEVPYKTEKQLEENIKAINSIHVLQKLHIDAVKAQSFEDFLKVLDKLEL